MAFVLVMLLLPGCPHKEQSRARAQRELQDRLWQPPGSSLLVAPAAKTTLRRLSQVLALPGLCLPPCTLL